MIQIRTFNEIISNISIDQMIEVDRLMIEEYKISLIQMMENAGRNLAELIVSLTKSEPRSTHVLVLAGSGGNGGGAMVAARHLSNRGYDVEIVFSKNISLLNNVPRHQADILSKFPIKIHEGQLPSKEYDIIIDGIIGYSLKGEAKGFSKEMIDFCNNSDAKIISLDVPSGLNLKGNNTNSTQVKAYCTMTLALPKNELINHRNKEYVGRLFLADISVPPSLYSQIGLEVSSNVFANGYIIELK